MSNSDVQMQLMAELDNAKFKIIELKSKNQSLEERIKELENENRWLKIFSNKFKGIIY